MNFEKIEEKIKDIETKKEKIKSDYFTAEGMILAYKDIINILSVENSDNKVENDPIKNHE